MILYKLQFLLLYYCNDYTAVCSNCNSLYDKGLKKYFVYSIVAEAILKFTVSCGSPFSCTNFSFVIFAKLSADNTCLGENGKKKHLSANLDTVLKTFRWNYCYKHVFIYRLTPPYQYTNKRKASPM